MAKTNKSAIMKLCNDINKKEGEGSIYSLGSSGSILKIKRWSTGIEDLDEITGGGFPEGRVVEIFGPEGSGKTTLLYHLCSLHDICIDFPVEGTYDEERAKLFGNREGQMLIGRTKYGEDTFNKIAKYARLGIPLIGVDSVPSLIPKDDYTKIEKSINNNTVDDLRIGGIARLITKYLPPIEDILELTGTTLIFTNQERALIGAMPFGEQTTTTGGKKLRHAASLRIKVARVRYIEIPNYNPKNSAAKEKIGMIMKCKIVKSKINNPMGECEIPLIYEMGFVSHGEIDEIKEKIAEERKLKYGKKKNKKKEEETFFDNTDDDNWDED